MNKIYKVIWSKVKHQYVVVSELAHSNGKQNSKSERTTVSGSLRALAAALVVSGSLLAMPYTASAAEGDVYYQLQNGDEVINIEENDLSSYFKIAEKQADGTYTINGQIVANEYLYDLGIDFNGDGKTEVGAFVVNDNIYTGDVYNQNHDVVIPEVQHTITNEDGFYASNGKGTYNSLTKDGLWVGGTKDGEGFHVDNDGNVRTTGNMMVDGKFSAGDNTVYVDENGNFQAANGKFTVDNDGTTYAHVGRSELQVTEDQAALRHGNNGVIVNEDGVAVVGEFTADNGIKAGLVGYDEQGNEIYGTQIGQDGSFSTAQGNFKVDAEGNVNAVNSNDSAITMNDDGVALNSAGNGIAISDEGILLNTNGSSITVDKFKGTTFTNTNTGKFTNINGDTVTTGKVTGLSNTEWTGTTDDASRAATEGQLSAVQGDLDVLDNEAVKYDKVNGQLTDNVTIGGDLSADNGQFVVKNGMVDFGNVADGTGILVNSTTGSITATGSIAANQVIGKELGGGNGAFKVTTDGKMTTTGEVLMKNDSGESFSITNGTDSGMNLMTVGDNGTGMITLNNGTVNLMGGSTTTVKVDGNGTTFGTLFGDKTTNINGDTITTGSINADGNVTATSIETKKLDVNGDLQADSGTIGGVELNDYGITAAHGSFTVDEQGNLHSGNGAYQLDVNGENGISFGSTFENGAKVTVTNYDVKFSQNGTETHINGNNIDSGNNGILHTGRIYAGNGGFNVDEYGNVRGDGSLYINSSNTDKKSTLELNDDQINLKTSGSQLQVTRLGVGLMSKNDTGIIVRDDSVTIGKPNESWVTIKPEATTFESDANDGVTKIKGGQLTTDDLTATSGNIGNVTLENGKVTADKADIGDVWINDGNITHIDKIAAKRADIGGVWIKDDTITSLTNTEWDAENAVRNRAATEGQLLDVDTKVNQNTDKLDAYEAAGIVPGITDKNDTEKASNVIALGNGSQAINDEAVAVGVKAIAKGHGAVSIGNNSMASATNTVAVGTESHAFGTSSVAIGANAEVKAGTRNSVALGAGSIADKSNVVSVGAEGAERQITNVAAGTELTDAVNVEQLQDVQTQVGEAIGTGDFSRTNYARGAENVTEAIYGVDAQVKNNTDDLDAYEDAGIVAGTRNNPHTVDGIALGTDSYANGTGATAIGGDAKANQYNSVALGRGAVANAHDSVALGAYSIANDENVVSVGRDDGSIQRRIVNVADGIKNSDVATVGQMNTKVAEATENMVEWDADTNDTIHGVTLNGGTITAANSKFKVYDNGRVEAAGGKFNVWSSGGIGIGDKDADDNRLFSVNGNNGNVFTKGDVTAQGTMYVNGDEEVATKSSVDTVNDTLDKYSNAGIIAGGVSEVGNGIALGQGSSANAGSVAIGNMNWVMGKDSVALGHDISVGGDEAVAIGNNISNVADNSVALGYGSVASREDTVSVGSSGNERQITNVKAGTENTDAVNVAQMNAKVAEATEGSVKWDAGTTNTINGVKLQDGDVSVTDNGTKYTLKTIGQNTAGITRTTSKSLTRAEEFTTTIEDTLSVDGSENRIAVLGSDGKENFVVKDGIVAVKNEEGTDNVFTVKDTGDVHAKGNLNVDGTINDGLKVSSGRFAVVDENGTEKFIVNNMGTMALKGADGVTNVFTVNQNGDVQAIGTINAKGMTVNGDNVALAKDVATKTSVEEINNTLDSYEDAGIVAGIVADTSKNKNNIAIGNTAKLWGSNENSIIIGNGNIFDNRNNSISMGNNVLIHGSGSIAIGNRSWIGSDADNSIAFGYNAKVKEPAQNAVAIGANSIATESNVVSVGNKDTSEYRRIVNVADGINAHDAATVGQMNTLIFGSTGYTKEQLSQGKALTNKATSLVGGINKNTNAINGILKNFGQSAVNWDNYTEKVDNVTNQIATFSAMTSNVDWNAVNSVDWNAVSALSQVAPLSADATGEFDTTREPINDGSSNTGDEINTGEGNTVNGDSHVTGNAQIDGALNVKGEATFDGNATFNGKVDMNGELNMNNNKITGVADGAIAEGSTDAVNGGQLFDMQSGLNSRMDNIENRMNDVEDRIDKVGAMAAAIANLRTMGYDPEAPTEIAVGVGQYRSETGLALGIFHYPNQDFMLSASISTSGDEVMGGIGATWKLGRKSAEERAKDEEERILAKAEEIKQAAKRAEVKAQADRHAQLLAEREAAGEPIRPVEEA